MVKQDSDPWLVLVFGRDLCLARLSESTRSSFTVDRVEYQAVDSNFLPTFHDRLVDERDCLVGIRIWTASTAAAGLFNGLPNATYLTFGAGFVDVWLSEAPIPGAKSTGDQAFGARIYRSASGYLALAIDIDYLCASEGDLANVERANARWVALT